MRSFWNLMIAGMVLLAIGFATEARAQVYVEGNPAGFTTVATTTTTTTGGTVALIVVLVNNNKKPTSHEAVKAAELFLKQNSVQIAQDLSTGNGPWVNDLARSMQIRNENTATFSKLLRSHRGELLALANPDTLTEERAVAFVQSLVDLMESDAGLRHDLHAFASSAQLN